MESERNPTMVGGNRFKLAVFGSNCSGGRAATTVPERWQNTFADNIRLAQMADAAGLEALVPIGRWKGYGGDTDYQGATWETVAWACGLLAKTERLTVFGTVHAPLIPPLIAAKEFVTADHIGEGRFGLISCAVGTRASSRCSARRCAITRRATNTRRNGWISSSSLGRRARISISMGVSSN